MDEDWEDEVAGQNVNFIPCVKWIKRGVAKSQPEKVKLTQEELLTIIKQTKEDLKVREEGDDDDAENDDEEEEENDDMEEEKEEVKDKIEDAKETSKNAEDEALNKEYDLDNYDDDGANQGASSLFGIGDLISHADPREDPYVMDPNFEDDASDIEDFVIKPTDNLLLAGHVEGDASTLEVYVYNDVEDALYVHHDILLPSFPLALEWLSYEPGEDTKGNLVAIGTMEPIIQVWDLDLVDGLEPVFSLGKKASKKKKIKGVGHTDAVLALAWNHHVEHVLASGGVDETVLLWDMSEGNVATKLTAHKEKIQAMQWHPMEAQTLLTGCCDEFVRVFDCRSEKSFKKWKVFGEVEKVLWNHFNPFTFLAATETGHVQMIDVRNDEKPVWTLQAHSEGINGMNLSTQCPDLLVTVSTDQTMKVWDIAEGKPQCVQEKDVKLGRLHCVDQCPDAPFVVAIGGDKSSDNLKVLDVREAAAVRSRFGNRKLSNPLGTSVFGFETLNDAEPDANTMEVNTPDEASNALESMSLEKVQKPQKEKPSGGAAGKFKKKDKKKKKNKNF